MVRKRRHNRVKVSTYCIFYKCISNDNTIGTGRYTFNVCGNSFLSTLKDLKGVENAIVKMEKLKDNSVALTGWELLDERYA